MPAKKVNVTRSWMLALADSIYNPQTRRFLRLCDGTLQNGPDPTDEKRPMHCGLGELYFAMTHHQPEEDGVSERDVVDLAVELSALSGSTERSIEAARKAINAIALPEELREEMIETLDRRVEDAENEEDEDSGAHEFMSQAEQDFRAALSEIPSSNDDGCGEDSCSYDTFRSRSARVAKKLRVAAKHLPA